MPLGKNGAWITMNNSMDFIYLLMKCVVTASIIVITASALWSILVLLTDSSDRHSRLYVITHTIGAITLTLFGIRLLTGWLKWPIIKYVFTDKGAWKMYEIGPNLSMVLMAILTVVFIAVFGYFGTRRWRKMTKLKPCPFCGGKARLVPYGDEHYFVSCTNIKCCATASRHMQNKDEAIKAWNRRDGEYIWKQ